MSSRKPKKTGRYELRTQNANGTTSGEFWEAEANGKFVTIRFGKIGSSGYQAAREFGSAKEADEFMAERLLTMIEKGYRPTQ